MLNVEILGNNRLTRLYNETVCRIEMADHGFENLQLAKIEAEKLYDDVNCVAISETDVVRKNVMAEFVSFKQSIEDMSVLELNSSLKKVIIHAVYLLASGKIREMKHLRSNIDRVVTKSKRAA
ncbi:hypothetical protein [Serratia sp. Se-RSBMAAmG]|uniref:hypothetical protein n=1 Tax=Serratia sp. Se-RSBMAAmG TaxID=3043305 RepID=UPI0024AF2F63|nr:hypothetical protein [Serratia sp. Se-RSBMAAmG]MDI6977145.1 hypothetical protein [Serratia sp. Se-RSBMAAmG]